MVVAKSGLRNLFFHEEKTRSPRTKQIETCSCLSISALTCKTCVASKTVSGGKENGNINIERGASQLFELTTNDLSRVEHG
jgi:hypothetical protein